MFRSNLLFELVSQFLLFSIYFINRTVCEEESLLIVEHTFDKAPTPLFTRRGSISIQSLKQGVATFNEDGEITSEQLLQLKDLVSTDGLYKIRAARKVSSTGTGIKSPHYIYSFVKACSLYESRLSDIITVDVDKSGNLLGMSLNTIAPYCQGSMILDDELTQFNTTIEVMQTVDGPAPETQTYVQKLEQEKAEKAKGQQTDNRSFLAKYWIYIIPVVVFVMFSQASQQQAAAS